MVEFKFHIKMPIFLARQHMRHRTASVNEMSARYSVVPDEFVVFDAYRGQSVVNKQGSEGVVAVSPDKQKESCESAFRIYTELLEGGVCREQARCHLPQATFTEFYWKINLHNLMHYLNLRMAEGAQAEIRAYAQEMFDIVQEFAPITMEAFLDFRIHIVSLSRLEVEAIRSGSLKIENPGENREFQSKRKILFGECDTSKSTCE
jgi:thymidylate synthase (FAD)